MTFTTLTRNLIWAAALPTLIATADPALTKEQMATFLRTAKVIKQRDVAKGITNSRRLTLSDGTVTHDAHMQSIDQSMMEFRGNRGTELNFKDSWKFNVAAYKLAEMLGIDYMVPMSVERNVGGAAASVTWWVDDVLMDEGQRLKDKAQPPDIASWNKQMWMLRVFDQLIHNTDRNMGNLLITKDWQIRMIDHTRAFRLSRTVLSEKNIEKCDRGVFAKMKQLDEATLIDKLKGYVNREEIRGLLARRDAIVKVIEAKGDNGLYDLN